MATTITANGINFPDGSAGSPSIGGTDTNTGLFTGSDIVGFATGGSERLRIDASGNINIANDSGKLQLGTSADLQIYHNGTNTYLDNNTGHLAIRTNVGSDVGSNIYLQPHDNEDGIVIVHDGGVELYHDNSKKFETTSAGAHVWGNLDFMDNANIRLGTGTDLQIYHDGSDSFIDDSGTGNLFIRSSQLQINKYTGENMIKAVADGAVELYHDNSKKFETTAGGATVHCTDASDGFIVQGDLRFRKESGTTTYIKWDGSDEQLEVFDDVKVSFGDGHDLQIYHDGSNSYLKNAGTGNIIFLSDDVQFKSDGGGNTGLTINTDAGVELYHNGSKKFETANLQCIVTGLLQAYESQSDSYYSSNNFSHIIQSNNEGSAILVLEHSGDSQPYGIYMRFSDHAPNNNTQYFMMCADSSGANRFIVWSDGDVQNDDNSYGSTSDVKLKENIVDAKSQWDDIKAIRVRNFNFKTDTPSDKRIGVVAQEIETVCPSLVVEHPDLDKDNKDLGTTTKSVKYSILYMKAIKALQEAQARIETLETKVAALEAE